MNLLNKKSWFKLRYIGDVGDVVVGRISAVETSRWRVDINSTLGKIISFLAFNKTVNNYFNYLDGMLPLTSVNLPGGELVMRYFC